MYSTSLAESGASVSDLSARVVFGRSHFARSNPIAALCLKSTGPTSHVTRMYEPSPQNDSGQMEFPLMQSAGDSHARTSAPQERVRGLKANAPDYGKSTPELLARYDPATSSWKTSQLCLDGDYQEFSETWPRSGMTRNGIAYRLPTLVHLTAGTDSGLWLTPRASDTQKGEKNETFLKRMGDRTDRCAQSLAAQVSNPQTWPTPDTRGFTNKGSLSMLVRACDSEEEFSQMAYRASKNTKAKLWPTPQASDHRDRGSLASSAVQRRALIGKQISLSQSVSEVSGALNPTWVEGLMGFPCGYTDIAGEG